MFLKSYQKDRDNRRRVPRTKMLFANFRPIHLTDHYFFYFICQLTDNYSLFIQHGFNRGDVIEQTHFRN